MTVANGLHAEGGGKVGFAGAADQHDVLCVVEDRAMMQFPHERFVDLSLGKVEAGQIPVNRELRTLHLVIDGPHLTFGKLGLEEDLKDPFGLPVGG